VIDKLEKGARRSNILAAIKKKEEGWKRTRNNRISASERLKGYSQKWGTITLLFNVEAVIFLIISLRFPLDSGFDAAFSGAFSLYVILIQYYLATLNYEAKAMKFHYEQLEIENLRLKLKRLYHSVENTELLEERYANIVSEYQENLSGYENHGALDDRRTGREKECESNNNQKLKKVRDFTLDNLMIYCNFILVLVSAVAFIALYIMEKETCL